MNEVTNVKKIAIAFGWTLGIILLLTALWFLLLYSITKIPGPHGLLIAPMHFVYFYIALWPAEVLYAILPILEEQLPDAVMAIGQIVFSTFIWTPIFFVVQTLIKKTEGA